MAVEVVKQFASPHTLNNTISAANGELIAHPVTTQCHEHLLAFGHILLAGLPNKPIQLAHD